jgi:hypothetical protein
MPTASEDRANAQARRLGANPWLLASDERPGNPDAAVRGLAVDLLMLDKGLRAFSRSGLEYVCPEKLAGGVL